MGTMINICVIVICKLLKRRKYIHQGSVEMQLKYLRVLNESYF